MEAKDWGGREFDPECPASGSPGRYARGSGYGYGAGYGGSGIGQRAYGYGGRGAGASQDRFPAPVSFLYISLYYSFDVVKNKFNARARGLRTVLSEPVRPLDLRGTPKAAAGGCSSCSM